MLFLVKDKGYSIKDAAQTLNLNYSTAKTIIQVYRKTGRIDKVDRNQEISQQLHNANKQLSKEISQMFCASQRLIDTHNI